MNTKTDGISSGLVAEFWLSIDCIGERYLCFSEPKDSNELHPLVRLSGAEAIIAAKDVEIERLKAILPDKQKRGRECKTLEDWKYLALYYESQWADCSYGFNLHAGKQAARIKELTDDLEESDAIRDRCAHLLAETAVALKGPEKALHRHGWQDLPEVAAKQSAALKLASLALSEGVEYVEEPPEKNCTCHLSPPCNDCVDHSAVREFFIDARKALAAIDALGE